MKIDEVPVTEAAAKKALGNMGGKRAGAGPKKGADGDAYTALAKARAKKETYRAHLEELKYNEAVGDLVKADDVRDAMATLLKSMMLTLETLAEAVEREAKLTPEQAAAIERIIDRERRSLHTALTTAGTTK